MSDTTTEIYGYRNTRAFNTRPEGDVTWWPTREERDAALSRFRARAVERGLSESAAIAGIRPIKRSVDDDTLQGLQDGATDDRWGPAL